MKTLYTFVAVVFVCVVGTSLCLQTYLSEPTYAALFADVDWLPISA